MTVQIENMTRRFARVFAPEQATVLAETIHDAYADLVKTSDFNELKEIVRDLAEQQQAFAQQQQAFAQEQRLLAQAQRDTDTRLGKLIDVVSNLAQEVGGLSRSASYALENESYRQLPAYLKANYDIVLEKRLVRSEINGEEVDIFALGQRNGTPIVVVGETKLQLDRRRGGRDVAIGVLDQLERKVEAVQLDYPEREAVRLLVTHYARPAVLDEAQKRNVIVVQSFDW